MGKYKRRGKIYCHFNDGAGNFTVKQCADQFAFAVTSGDYNGDGIVDLIASGGWFEKNCIHIIVVRNTIIP